MNIQRFTPYELKQIGLTVVGIGTALLALKRKSVKRRWPERPHLGVRNRNNYGQQRLLMEMALSDQDSFFSILRLTPNSFDKLLEIVGPSITHFSPREPINPHTRLCVTLRYLATGESPTSLSYTYRLGISTTKMIIIETLTAVINKLKPLYMPEPSNDMLLESAKGFAQRWNFPNCCGSVDGKHIRIKKPVRGGSRYWNYKKFNSIVMMAICDYKYRFLAVDVGCQGVHNDSVVFNSSKLGHKLMNGTFNLPGESDIPFGPRLPHILLADTIFGNRPYLITPYPGRTTGNLSYEEKIFNYRQSRGRRVIENTFGIYAQTWRIFRGEINAGPDIVDRIVLASACLHNFRLSEQADVEPFDQENQADGLNDEFRESFDKEDPADSLGDEFHSGMISIEQTPTEFIDIDFRMFSAHPPTDFMDFDSGIVSIPQEPNHYDVGGNYIRDELAEYFVSDGSVYWQDQMIN